MTANSKTNPPAKLRTEIMGILRKQATVTTRELSYQLGRSPHQIGMACRELIAEGIIDKVRPSKQPGETSQHTHYRLAN
jgi:hypothetical protein